MVQNFVNNLLRRNPQPENVQIQPLQLDINGNYDPAASAALGLQIQQNSTPLTVNDRLFGREMTQDYQKINPETNQVEMATLTNRKPGLINDFMGGLRENYNEGLQAENLMPNQNKGWATRLGEGFGTALRFADKPIGRFALASGLSALTGEANPLAEGVTAYVGRQQNQTADKVYRQQLKQLGYSDEDLNNIPGIVTKDIFEGLTSGMRLGNQRITYGQLAQFDDEVAEMINKNPMLANQFVPITLARDVYGKKREKTEADIEGTKAKTEKTKAETGQVGKPRVNISIRKGGTTSVIRHEGGSGGKSTNTGSGQSNMVRVKAPDGRTGTIPRANLRKAINAGYEVI